MNTKVRPAVDGAARALGWFLLVAGGLVGGAVGFWTATAVAERESGIQEGLKRNSCEFFATSGRMNGSSHACLISSTFPDSSFSAAP